MQGLFNKRSKWRRAREEKERIDKELKEEKEKKAADAIPLWMKNEEVDRRSGDLSLFGMDDYSGATYTSNNSWAAYHSNPYTSNTYSANWYTPTEKFNWDDFKTNTADTPFSLEDVVKTTFCDFKVITTHIAKDEYQTFITSDTSSKIVGKYKSESAARRWHKTYLEEVPKHQKSWFMYSTVIAT